MLKNVLAALLVATAMCIGNCCAQLAENATNEVSSGIEENISMEVNVSIEKIPNILETAAAIGEIDMFISAINSTELAGQLSGEGPFTIFAPIDEAVEAIPSETFSILMNNTEALMEILSYHIVSGKIMAADITNLTSIPTLLEGGNLTVNVTEDRIMVDGAEVIQPNIEASNGIIHTIDAVLIPTFEEEPAQEGVEPSPICVSNVTRELLQSINMSLPANATICEEEEVGTQPICLSSVPCE